MSSVLSGVAVFRVFSGDGRRSWPLTLDWGFPPEE